MARHHQIVYLAPGKLTPNPWNTNVVSPDNERKIAVSLKRFGFFKPILCRELADGTLQILGGEHRWQAAKNDGSFAEVPVLNLGRISDQKAKEISLVDNGRYGSDDTLRLAELLEGLGDMRDLSSFMPYDSADLESIFSASSIDLDSLEVPDEDDHELPAKPASTKAAQEFQVMRFKVPVGDAHEITQVIDQVMKAQRFDKDDSLTNAGMALVHVFQNLKESA